MTSVITETALTPAFRLGLRALSDACQAQNSSSPDSFEDGDVFFFLEETGQDGQPFFSSALVLYSIEEDLFECAALTRPDLRREGRFSRLLEAAADYAPEAEFSFPVPDNSPEKKAVMEAIGAELWYQEHLMEWTPGLSALPDRQTALSFSQTGDAISVTASSDPEHPDAVTASCLLTLTSGSACCLHRVLVPEPLRGQGYGSLLLSTLLGELSRKGIKKAVLQVSGDNAPALALYRKTGFRITETLSYYLY